MKKNIWKVLANGEHKIMKAHLKAAADNAAHAAEWEGTLFAFSVPTFKQWEQDHLAKAAEAKANKNKYLRLYRAERHA